MEEAELAFERWNTHFSLVLEQDVFGTKLRLCQDPNSEHLGTTVWDASIVMAKYLEKNVRKGDFARSRIRGKCGIELGAGMGLGGLALAMVGADVVLTDVGEVLPLLQRNYELNLSPSALRLHGKDVGWAGAAGKVSIQELDWSNAEHIQAAKGPYHYVLAADCIYHEYLLEHLYNTIMALTDDKSTVLIANELRSQSVQSRFLSLFAQSFTIKRVPAKHMDPLYQHASIEVYVLKRRKGAKQLDAAAVSDLLREAIFVPSTPANQPPCSKPASNSTLDKRALVEGTLDESEEVLSSPLSPTCPSQSSPSQSPVSHLHPQPSLVKSPDENNALVYSLASPCTMPENNPECLDMAGSPVSLAQVVAGSHVQSNGVVMGVEGSNRVVAQGSGVNEGKHCVYPGSTSCTRAAAELSRREAHMTGQTSAEAEGAGNSSASAGASSCFALAPGSSVQSCLDGAGSYAQLAPEGTGAGSTSSGGSACSGSVSALASNILTAVNEARSPQQPTPKAADPGDNGCQTNGSRSASQASVQERGNDRQLHNQEERGETQGKGEKGEAQQKGEKGEKSLESNSRCGSAVWSGQGSSYLAAVKSLGSAGVYDTTAKHTAQHTAQHAAQRTSRAELSGRMAHNTAHASQKGAGGQLAASEYQQQQQQQHAADHDPQQVHSQKQTWAMQQQQQHGQHSHQEQQSTLQQQQQAPGEHSRQEQQEQPWQQQHYQQRHHRKMQQQYRKQQPRHQQQQQQEHHHQQTQQYQLRNKQHQQQEHHHYHHQRQQQPPQTQQLQVQCLEQQQQWHQQNNQRHWQQQQHHHQQHDHCQQWRQPLKEQAKQAAATPLHSSGSQQHAPNKLPAENTERAIVLAGKSVSRLSGSYIGALLAAQLPTPKQELPGSASQPQIRPPAASQEWATRRDGVMLAHLMADIRVPQGSC